MNKDGKELKKFIKSELKEVRAEMKGGGVEHKDVCRHIIHQLNIILNKMDSMEQKYEPK